MRLTVLALLGLAVVVAAGIVFADAPGGTATGTTGKSQPVFVASDDDNVAIKGYDVVAYFTDMTATPGSSEHVVEWRGAKWHFASAENMARFQENPRAYAPQYGGYCAWGVAAKNDLFEIDPQAWKIVDNKLYLNFNKDIQQQWLADIQGFINQADENWPKLVESHIQ